MRDLLGLLCVGGITSAVACGASQATQRLDDSPPSGDRSDDNLSIVSEADGTQLVYRCGDPVLNDQLTSGTERLTTWVPCWSVAEEAEIVRSDRERIAPRSEALAQAELVYCKGIPERERAHSPFAHRQAIAEIIPHRESGRVRGVRVVFEAVPGLTTEWMERALACQKARYEVLRTPSYLLDNPTLVEGADITVVARVDGGVEVVIRSDDDRAAQLALSRAQDLLRDQTALR